MAEICEPNLVANDEENSPVGAHSESSHRGLSPEESDVAAGPRAKWVIAKGLEGLVETASDFRREAR